MAKILDLVVEEAVFVQRIGRLDSAAGMEPTDRFLEFGRRPFV
jgi:hypothetical protein